MEGETMRTFGVCVSALIAAGLSMSFSALQEGDIMPRENGSVGQVANALVGVKLWGRGQPHHAVSNLESQESATETGSQQCLTAPC